MTHSTKTQYKKIISGGCLAFLMISNLLFAQPVVPDRSVFTVEELEKLGASTVHESLKLLKSNGNAEVVFKGKNIGDSASVDTEALLKEISLDDVERIEVLKEGDQVRYHLSKTLSKDGVKALFTFTLLEEQEKESKLDPVVTTATKMPVKRSQLGDVVRVIHGDELETLGVQTVIEALNTFGNISATNAGGTASTIMRGFAEGNTKILINGIDLNDSSSIESNSSFFPYIPISDIDRIEVLSGASSVMYGTGAAAGVINIIYKQAMDKNVSGYVSSKVGYRNKGISLKQTLNVKDNYFYILGSYDDDNSRSALSGTPEKDLFRNYSVQVGADTKALDWMVSLINGKQETDDFFSKVDDDSFGEHQMVLASAYYPLYLSSQSRSGFRFKGASGDRKYYKLETLQWGYNFSNISLDMHYQRSLNEAGDFIVGFDYIVERAEGLAGDYFAERKEFRNALYSQLVWDFSWVSSQFGYRVEHYKKGSKYVPVSTYNASLIKRIPKIDLDVVGTIKTGLKLPTMYKRNKPKNEYGSGNKNLEEETSFTKEISFSKKIKQFVFKSTFFDSDITNKISWETFGTDDMSDDTYFNVGSSRYRGSEYSLEVNDALFLDFLRLNYTALNAVEGGETVKKVPDYKYTLIAGLQYKKINYGISLVGESEKGDYGDKFVDAFVYADLTLRYAYNETRSFYSKIHNITNESYETVASYSQPGRTLYFGFKQQF